MIYANEKEVQKNLFSNADIFSLLIFDLVNGAST